MHRDTNAIANPIRIAKNVCLFGIQEMLKSEIVLFETLANSIDPTLEDIADPIRIDATEQNAVIIKTSIIICKAITDLFIPIAIRTPTS